VKYEKGTLMGSIFDQLGAIQPLKNRHNGPIFGQKKIAKKALEILFPEV
jgi:hypothetical protein